MKQYNPGELSTTMTSCYFWNNKTKFGTPIANAPMWIFFYVEKGKFSYHFGEFKGIATDKDLLLCPPNTAFSREMMMSSTFIACSFFWRTRDGMLIENEHQLYPNPIGKHIIRDVQRLNSTCEFLRKIVNNHDEQSVIRRNFLLQDIWQLFFWEWETTRQHQKEHSDPLMKQVEQTMRENAFQHVHLTALAREIGLSAVQFMRRFKAVFGVTPIEYLTEIRLNRARILLVESTKTLHEIASECGYENGFYLSRIFSKKMNMSPSQYRQYHRV